MRHAIRATVAVFGVLAGLAGLEHGVGEILQGNVAPPATVFQSWPDSPAFEVLSGEPAMTLVPNLRLTGILAVLWSVAVGLWALLGAHRKHGGLVLILLALVGLPLGAGFGPPLLAVITGLTATRSHAPLRGWRSRQRLAALWPWSLGSALTSWLLLMPGSLILSRSLPLSDPGLLPAVLIPSSFGLLILTILSAMARDASHEYVGREYVGHEYAGSPPSAARRRPAAGRRLAARDDRA